MTSWLRHFVEHLTGGRGVGVASAVGEAGEGSGDGVKQPGHGGGFEQLGLGEALVVGGGVDCVGASTLTPSSAQRCATLAALAATAVALAATINMGSSEVVAESRGSWRGKFFWGNFLEIFGVRIRRSKALNTICYEPR